MPRKAIQQALNLRHEEHFRAAYLVPALECRLVEMTIPDKPNSRLQKYRLTPPAAPRSRNVSAHHAAIVQHMHDLSPAPALRPCFDVDTG